MATIHWQPQIGDPTFAGWFTVFSYFLAAFLAFYIRRGFSTRDETYRVQRRFWLIVGILMIGLGFNKQLDLQSLLTATGKYYAYKQGWYEDRGRIQIAFIVSILILGLAFLFWGIYTFHGLLKKNWLAFTGIIFLVMFILIRASSFHHMDHLIGERILGLKMNWLFELSGIYCIVLNAFAIQSKFPN